MDPTHYVNVRVDVIAIYKAKGDISTLCFPYKMKYKGEVIIFTELCMRHPTSKGKRMIHIYDMSDGINDYRLENDAEARTWTLIAILGGTQTA